MKTVLVVDDNDINRYLAVQVLERGGFRVVQASSGAEALAAVADGPPDVMVLDIQMPGLSGFDVLARIRGSEQSTVARMPILAATALAMAEDRERCLRLGATGFLPRPFGMKELVARVRALAEAPDAGN